MKFTKALSFVRRMGLRYICYRFSYELSRKSGMLMLLYPVKVPPKQFINLQQWRLHHRPFFFNSQNIFPYNQEEKSLVKSSVTNIRSGMIQFFTNEWITLGSRYDWMTNPTNGFRFDKNRHWTKVNDFNEIQGDIKYVWEKARFSYLLTIARNDFANNEDNSEFVWHEILSWIRNTNYNCGPHYKCSQEISIRILNWLFIIYYYKNCSSLTEDIFSEILNSIYLQTKHVEQNFLFSKIAVRNNHAISEALCLFTVGLLFPWFPDSRKWLLKGKESLEEECLYQIYNDGSYIQHSFNYQRVVVQLYTYAFSLGKCNGITFSEPLVERLKKCVLFLYQFIDSKNGHVPNLGANDSALFFPLNNRDPKDFRPQINALYAILFDRHLYIEKDFQEDAFWFGILPKLSHDIKITSSGNKVLQTETGVQNYSDGGYYILKTNRASTYIRCARYRHRPYHADNLHVDITYNHKNILRDSGTYKYNTDSESIKFFSGSAGHNTVMIDDLDQMEKGKRFIWYNWSEALEATVAENDDYLKFEGRIKAFQYLNKEIIHKRIVKVIKDIPLWIINDNIIMTSDGHRFSQIWNISDDFFDEGFTFKCISGNKDLKLEIRSSWFSEYYGEKKPSKQVVFNSSVSEFNTAIYHESISNILGDYFS